VKQPMIYEISDQLHRGRRAYVAGDQIADTVGRWLAELGATSGLVLDLQRAVRVGDWGTAHQIGDCLSVEVSGPYVA
jgi:hypothetical protein